MNFADFSFWWTLLITSSLLLFVRFVAQQFNRWSYFLDRVGVMILSLVIFYAAARESFVIFALELVLNYAAVRIMQRTQDWKRVAIAAVTIAINLGILIYFKYLTFIVADVLRLSVVNPETGSSSGLFANSLGIPPGISFYTFQMVAFVVDSFNSPDKQILKFIDYVNFTAFFPQVVAGPIERRGDLLPQMQSFRFQFSLANMSAGARWIILGLFMKLVLSDNLSHYVNLAETQNAWVIWLSIYLFGFQIYFDFAGYSLIALGLARLVNVQLRLNFQSPYLSISIQEFWRRWHITLSTWFRDYVYLPLGGSKVPWAAANVFTVFLISGIWHGAGWNFVLWGGYHGMLLVLHRYVSPIVRLPKWAGWFLTFNVVMVGWFFFMEMNMSRMGLKIQTLLTPIAYSLRNLKDIVLSVHRPTFAILVSAVIVFLMVEFLAQIQQRSHGYQLFLSAPVVRLLLALLILVSAKEAPQFIYFAF